MKLECKDTNLNGNSIPKGDENRVTLYIPKGMKLNIDKKFNHCEANVSLNWLLNEECTIEHLFGDIKWL